MPGLSCPILGQTPSDGAQMGIRDAYFGLLPGLPGLGARAIAFSAAR